MLTRLEREALLAEFGKAFVCVTQKAIQAGTEIEIHPERLEQFPSLVNSDTTPHHIKHSFW